MEQTNNSINKLLMRQRLFIIFIFIFNICLVCGVLYFYYELNKKALNNVRVIDLNGNIYNSRFEEYNYNSIYNYRGFIILICDHLYDYNFTNYKPKNEFCATLGDNSLKIFIESQYPIFKEVLNLKGFSSYNRIYASTSIKIVNNSFSIHVEQNISATYGALNYKYIITGELFFSGEYSDFNPHGLIAKNLKFKPY